MYIIARYLNLILPKKISRIWVNGNKVAVLTTKAPKAMLIDLREVKGLFLKKPILPKVRYKTPPKSKELMRIKVSCLACSKFKNIFEIQYSQRQLNKRLNNPIVRKG